jgi:hypothetical protein
LTTNIQPGSSAFPDLNKGILWKPIQKEVCYSFIPALFREVHREYTSVFPIKIPLIAHPYFHEASLKKGAAAKATKGKNRAGGASTGPSYY